MIQELEKKLSDLEAQQKAVLYLVHLSSFAEHLNDRLIYLNLTLFQTVPVSCVSHPRGCEVQASHELEEKEIQKDLKKLERTAGVSVQQVVPHMQQVLKYSVIVVVFMIPFATNQWFQYSLDYFCFLMLTWVPLKATPQNRSQPAAVVPVVDLEDTQPATAEELRALKATPMSPQSVATTDATGTPGAPSTPQLTPKPMALDRVICLYYTMDLFFFDNTNSIYVYIDRC